jgi:hypothetical protein
MYRSCCSAGAFGKVAHLAMLGVGILFVGPIALGIGATLLGVVVAILGAAVPFVLIGAIAYGPYVLVRRMLGHNRQPVVLDARRAVPRPQPIQLPVVEIPVERPMSAPRRPRQRGVVARVAGEVFCGALVGGVLGAVTVLGPVGDWQMSALLNYSALGAGIGAVVGFVVGGPRPAPVEQTPTVS